MSMGTDDTIGNGNGNGKVWGLPCMGMGMTLISMGINSHRRMQCLAYVTVKLRLHYVPGGHGSTVCLKRSAPAILAIMSPYSSFVKSC